MIDYDRAELDAAELLRRLRGEQRVQRRRRCFALRFAWLVAGLEFIVILAGAIVAL